MPMKFSLAGTIALGVVLAAPAEAHRGWLLPSSTVLSGEDTWVTVDAAKSNDLFYFDHNAMRLDDLKVTGPDGAAVEPQNANTGRYRSTFDVNLKQQGTYRIAVVNDGLFASYKVDGKPKRWRGTADKVKAELPAEATDVRLVEAQSRVEVFVTSGKPSGDNLAPTGRGLELVPDTHPNDLFAGEEAKFRLLMDGKPAKGLEVEIVPGGNRYRDKLNDMKIVTDDNGAFAVTWPNPGMYWIEASVRDATSEIEGAQRRATYAATLEVLPQ